MSRLIRIDSLYKCYGVIFDSSYRSPIEIKHVLRRINLTEKDIIVAEQIFVSQYNLANQASEGTRRADHLINVRQYFNLYNRQYLGYADNGNVVNIIINLFDYENRKAVNRYLGDGWKSSFVVLFAEKMPFKIFTYRVDITQKKLFATF